MREDGIDIGHKRTNDVFTFFREGRLYEYVLAVCTKDTADRCPIFPGVGMQRLHWPFDDPSTVTGSQEQKMTKVRVIRDQIRQKVPEFLKAQA